MKLELPTWAYAAAASAGILAGATYFALQPPKAQLAPQAAERGIQQAVDFQFPDAIPAPQDLAELAQQLHDTKRYYDTFLVNEHETGTCTNREGQPLKDCAQQCPDEPELFGSMTLNGNKYNFSAIKGRVVNLATPGLNGEHYYIYFWGEVTPELTRNGPYKYSHERKAWQKVPRWWPDRKTK
jgi:hypothetical protein